MCVPVPPSSGTVTKAAPVSNNGPSNVNWQFGSPAPATYIAPATASLMGLDMTGMQAGQKYNTATQKWETPPAEWAALGGAQAGSAPVAAPNVAVDPARQDPGAIGIVNTPIATPAPVTTKPAPVPVMEKVASAPAAAPVAAPVTPPAPTATPVPQVATAAAPVAGTITAPSTSPGGKVFQAATDYTPGFSQFTATPASRVASAMARRFKPEGWY